MDEFRTFAETASPTLGKMSIFRELTFETRPAMSVGSVQALVSTQLVELVEEHAGAREPPLVVGFGHKPRWGGRHRDARHRHHNATIKYDAGCAKRQRWEYE